MIVDPVKPELLTLARQNRIVRITDPDTGEIFEFKKITSIEEYQPGYWQRHLFDQNGNVI